MYKVIYTLDHTSQSLKRAWVTSIFEDLHI